MKYLFYIIVGSVLYLIIQMPQKTKIELKFKAPKYVQMGFSSSEKQEAENIKGYFKKGKMLIYIDLKKCIIIDFLNKKVFNVSTETTNEGVVLTYANDEQNVLQAVKGGVAIGLLDTDKKNVFMRVGE